MAHRCHVKMDALNSARFARVAIRFSHFYHSHSSLRSATCAYGPIYKSVRYEDISHSPTCQTSESRKRKNRQLKMPIQSLIQQAGLRIPTAALFFAEEHHGTVINQNFIQYVKRPRGWEKTNLREVCGVCRKNGDCLCYLFQIRNTMFEVAWGEESDYIDLEDWLNLRNQHRH